MKIEPKLLTPYLPYSLKVIMEGKKCNVAWMSTKNIAIIRPDGIGDVKKINWEYAHLNVKPILRPMSDLTMEFWENNITDPVQILEHKDIDFIKNNPRGHYKFYQLLYLFKHHFDVFGLIEKGLAIDINTLRS